MPSQEMFDKVALLAEGAMPAEATWQERREAYDSLLEVFSGTGGRDDREGRYGWRAGFALLRT